MNSQLNHRRLTLEVLEDRAVPAAYVSSGFLYVVGSNANDTVTVRNVTVNGVLCHQVNENGRVSNFAQWTVTQGIAFYGYGGNDYFNHYTGRNCWAYGGDGNDTLNGSGGFDRLDGGNGNDVLNGYDGNDYLIGGAGDDRLWAGSGNDRLWGDAGVDQLVGEAGDDQLMGGADQDELWGMDGNDSLWGDGGLDFLVGGNGNDYLDGGADSGIAWGGAGADRFVNLPEDNRLWFTDFVAPYTRTLRGLPGIRDFSAAQGDRR